MTPKIRTDRQANLTGSAWMIAAMALFAVEDAGMKAASLTLPVGQILILFGLGGAVMFAIWAGVQGDRLFSRDTLSVPMQVRAGFEIAGRLFYVLALALTPLAATTVILQATPIVVVAGAAVFLGEPVGWRRWIAILVGLSGVLIILRPGDAAFSALSLLAVVGMLGFAGRDLASRAAPPSVTTPVLGLYGFLAVVVAGVLYSLWDRAPFLRPDIASAACLGAAIVAGVAAYSCLMKAMRTGQVAAVTPFRYTRLLFGIGLGVLVFGERITPQMILGSGLIVLSGLFLLWRKSQIGNQG